MCVRIVALVIGSVLMVACSPPSAARPREGAPVNGASAPTRTEAKSAAPATLAPAALLAAPPPSSPQSVAIAPSPTPGHVIAATGGTAVNMRTGPSTAAPVVTTLREGTPVEALGDPVSADGRRWQAIRVGDKSGWVVAPVVRPR